MPINAYLELFSTMGSRFLSACITISGDIPLTHTQLSDVT